LPLVLTAYQWHAETLSAKQQSDAQTASDLLALSRVYDDSLDTFGGAMTRWDVKRLQFLCFLNAIEVAVLNVVCLRWRSVGRNLRLAWRALSASLS
jgi:hypothetical protein